MTLLPIDANRIFETAADAAERWRKRDRIRAEKLAALADKKYTRADTSARLAARLKRLGKWIEASANSGKLPLEAAATSASTATLRPEDITDELIERTIGNTKDFLSIEFFEQGLSAARAVGRIVTRGTANGTGILVAPGIVLTNWHVLRTPQDASLSELELDYETNRFGPAKQVQAFKLLPEKFFYSNKDLDFALSATAKASANGALLADYGFRPLIGEEGKVRIGECVNIIQHPEGREKQIVLRESRLVDLPDIPGMEAYFHYTADTERGSSGSPVFNDQWEVVALHHSAVPKTDDAGNIIDADGQPIRRGDDPSRYVWVANEGIRVSRIVNQLRMARLRSAEENAIRSEVLQVWETFGLPAVQENAAKVSLSSTARGLDPGEARPTGSQATAAPLVNPPIPVQLTIALTADAGVRPSVRLHGTIPSEDLLERIEPDPSDPAYLSRPGYQPGFLGVDVPFPELVDERHGPKWLSDQGGDGVLRYHHFSVLMNERRRLAYVAAVNIDAGAPFNHDREGSDRWFFDPRLPRRCQAGKEYYANNPLDRGHLVRRDDAAWGYDALEAKLANDDTFHWTNCTPQHEIYNQADKASKKGLMLWGNLERAVSRLAASGGQKMTVFNGPIFSPDDRAYRQDFFLPREFWKIIVVPLGDDTLRAFGFRLSQSSQLDDLELERLPTALSGFEPSQVSVAAIENDTGLDFGPLRRWCALGECGDARESLGQDARVVRLASERDIVVA